MAKLVVTSTTNTISVEFNDYSATVEMAEKCYQKTSIRCISLNTFVHVFVDSEREWIISTNGASGSLQVDTVNGVAPSSNSDLYDKLCALIA